MSAKTFLVEITNGEVKPLDPANFPQTGRGILTVAAEKPAERKWCEIVDGPAGFPIIRGHGGIITSDLVRELDSEPW